MPGPVLGIDLGTSSVKVALVGPDGIVVALERAAYPTVRTEPGQATQDVAAWIAALEDAVGRLGRRFDLGALSAVGLAGQIPTLVALCGGEVDGPAVTWMDGRADALTKATLDPARRRMLYRATGMPIDGRYLGPMYAHRLRAGGRTADRILSAKDYLYLWLTGIEATDPATAAGYGAFALADGAFDPALLALWHLTAAQVAPVRPSSDLEGRLRPEAAARLGLRPGLRVAVGTADSVAAVVGSGALAEGTVALVPGSSTVILASVRAARRDRRGRILVTPHALPGWYGLEMDLLTTGSAVAWLSGLTGQGEDALVAKAAEVEPGAGGLRFAPYLAGAEQGALWRDDLAGAVLGLTLGHGPTELMRALLEGIAFEVRRAVEALEAAGIEVREVVVAGGESGAAPTGERILADVLGRPVLRVALESAAALGAALLTGQTAVDPADAAAVRRLTQAQALRLVPEAGRVGAYRTLAAAYRRDFPHRAAVRHREEGI